MTSMATEVDLGAARQALESRVMDEELPVATLFTCELFLIHMLLRPLINGSVSHRDSHQMTQSGGIETRGHPFHRDCCSVMFEFAESSETRVEPLYMLAGVVKAGNSKQRQVKLVRKNDLEAAKSSLEVSSVHIYR